MTPKDQVPETLDSLFKRAGDLIRPYILIDKGNGQIIALDSPSPDVIASIRKGIELYDDILTFVPDHWQSWWLKGKAFQALNEHEASYTAFWAAYKIDSSNLNVGRELVLECMYVGKKDEAVEVARQTSTRKPADAGLRANYAMTLIMAGQVDEGTKVVAEALALDPNDVITIALQKHILEIVAGTRPRPTTMEEWYSEKS